MTCCIKAVKKEGGGFGCDLASLGEVSTRMEITKDEDIKHCPVHNFICFCRDVSGNFKSGVAVFVNL